MKCSKCGHINETKAMIYRNNMMRRIIIHYSFTEQPPYQWNWLTASQIANSIGIEKPSKKETRAIAACFREGYNGENSYFRRTNGRNVIKTYTIS